MNISLNWLKDFVEIPSDITARKFAEDLTVRVVEVDGVTDQSKLYDNMVVGKIKEIKDHPNADKLKLCIVDIGRQEPVQIVCGGVNIYEGMICAIALPGSKVKWHGEGDLVELEETKIRGEKSFGMICAAVEIGLVDEYPTDEPYVMDLKIDAIPGTPLADALGLDDVIIDIDNKSLTHRPDLWGHFGIAREVATMYGSEFPPTETSDSRFRISEQIANSDNDNMETKVQIENEQLCKRFMALRIDNVKVAPSSPEIQKRLMVAGMRPINNIVDISNYVMLELGQPNHMFDADKLGDKLIIRNAKADEKITTLDGIERELDTSMLVVANEKEPLAIAGVMGGGDVEVDDETVSIIIEVANFDPVSIRATSQKLGLRTEASARFEKGLDPNIVKTALERIVDLLLQSVPEAKVGVLTDIGNWKQDPIVIKTSVEFIQKRIGADVDIDRIASILKSLGFSVEIAGAGNLDITVPSWRATGDVSLPEDIVEEVARHYGYHLIEPKLPLMDTKGDDQTNRDICLERAVKRFLTLGAGFQEVENQAFDNVRISKLLGIDPRTQEVEVINPLSSDQQYLRRSLLARLLGNIKDNLRYKNEFSIFEIGRIFKPTDSEEFSVRQGSDTMLPDQPRRLCSILTSRDKDDSRLFFEMKGVVEELFKEIGIPVSFVLQSSHDWLSDTAELGIIEKITGDEKVIGEFGVLHPQIIKTMKLDASVVVLYLDYELMTRLPRTQARYKEIPSLPAVMRDIAVVVSRDIPYANLEEVISKQSDLLESYELFDVYEGSQVGAGKRSFAWHLSFRHQDKTLKADEVDIELQKIIDALKREFGASLRS